MEEQLSGGREGKIIKSKDKVIRPANSWTPYVQQFLEYMHRHGADFVPKPYGINENGQEVLSYVKGEVYNYPLPAMYLKDEMIVSAAKLLHMFHDCGTEYVKNLTGKEAWMLPVQYPVEVMCHGDFAPYNVVVCKEKATAMIDFDTLHPGPRLWDVAYAIYRFVPFTSPDNPDHYEDKLEQWRKAKLFLKAYGMEEKEKDLKRMMVKRLEALTEYMRQQDKADNLDVRKNIEEGHLKVYLSDIEYIKNNYS